MFNKKSNPVFTFQGKLELIKEEGNKKGSIQKNSNDKGWEQTRIDFNASVKGQGTFRLRIEGSNFPVKFLKLDDTGNIEKDVKGNNVSKEFKSGDKPLKWENYLVTGNTYNVKGSKETIYYHPLDFALAVEKNIKSFVGKKVKITGVVEKSFYKGKLYEQYMIKNIEFDNSIEEEFLVVNEVLGVETKEIKSNIELPTYDFAYVKGKDKSDYLAFKHKVLKLNKNIFFDGAISSMFEEDGSVSLFTDVLKEIKDYPIVFIKANYKPVIKNNTTENKQVSTEDKIESLEPMYKDTYNMLIKAGKEKEAEMFLNNVYKAVKVAEGGFKIEYFLVQLDFSTDNNMKSFEIFTHLDFPKTTISLIEQSKEKATKNTKLLSKFIVKEKNELEEDNDFGNGFLGGESNTEIDGLSDEDFKNLSEEQKEEEKGVEESNEEEKTTFDKVVEEGDKHKTKPVENNSDNDGEDEIVESEDEFNW